MSEEQGFETNPTPVSQKLMHDIQVILSRLVAKASQLIGNFTTNLGCMYGRNLTGVIGPKVAPGSIGAWELD